MKVHLELLVIDKELHAVIPAHSKVEKIDLEKAILSAGEITDPIFAWKDNGQAVIADGMTRFDIWQKHKDTLKPPRVEVLDLPDRDAVVLWMLRRQLGRRNLTGNAARVLRGRMYKAIKADKKKNLRQGDKPPEISKSPMFSPKGQNVPSGESEDHKAAAEVAEQSGVNEKTVRRDADLVDALAVISKVNEKAAKDIADNALKVPAKDVIAISKMEQADIGKALNLIRRGLDWKAVKPKPAPKAEKPKKSVAPLYDDRKISAAIGVLIREIDNRGNAMGKTSEYDLIVETMKVVAAQWKKWQKEST